MNEGSSICGLSLPVQTRRSSEWLTQLNSENGPKPTPTISPLANPTFVTGLSSSRLIHFPLPDSVLVHQRVSVRSQRRDKPRYKATSSSVTVLSTSTESERPSSDVATKRLKAVRRRGFMLDREVFESRLSIIVAVQG